jgi:hypothetical protein
LLELFGPGVAIANRDLVAVVAAKQCGTKERKRPELPEPEVGQLPKKV